MSQPFAFLEEEEEERDPRTFRRWMPLILTGLALVGFFSVPLVVLLGGGRSEVREVGGFRAEPVFEGSISLDDPVPLDDASLDGLFGPDSSEIAGIAEEEVDRALAGLAPPRETREGGAAAIEAIGGQGKRGTGPAEEGELETPPAAYGLPEVAGDISRSDRVVVIEKGDNLYRIARGVGLTVPELARFNGIDPNQPIFPGQELRVPAIPNRPGPTPEARKVRPYKMIEGDGMRPSGETGGSGEMVARPISAIR